ncbi:SIMPL domain-containing protein [Paenibacillus pinistramenti]|uniref:SIMPL domain-containing protein n=1 Tax=Paenibacillus pinistramenti TaxID=1768003 RepID=UPI0011082502|nr:SIMPL domain-containing protein [Paenibacillus pinistramenti]
MNSWAKKLGTAALAGGLILGGSAAGTLLPAGSAAYAAESQVNLQNTITVTGTGQVSVKPDIAYLSLGVETTALTAKDAQAKNAAIVQKLSTLLKTTWKIDPADIQTSQFYVQPNYTYNDKEGQKITGYTANQTFQVKYRDLEKIGQLLDAASSAGANRINDVTFSVENPDQYLDQVISKAMANAGMKAGSIAKAAGQTLGGVINVVQNDGGYTPVVKQAEMLMQSTSSADAASTAVETGELTVQTSLTVQYEMK